MSLDEAKSTNDSKILKLGDIYENRGQQFVLDLSQRLMRGFLLFKRRKGEIVGGGVTFFAILSFCPVLLLLVTLVGHFTGDMSAAQTHVISFIKSNVPNIAPWILKSFSEIVGSQLKSSAGLNVVNMVILLYASLGIISSLMFGIKTISHGEYRGGFLIEDLKGLATGAFVYTFMLGFIFLSHEKLFFAITGLSAPIAIKTMRFLISSGILPGLLSLGFFTLLYKWAPPIKVTLKDSFWGALAFVGCFFVGKSFYWVYLTQTKVELEASYGNFYTLFVAAFWLYFLMCALFFGASVAYVPYQGSTGLKSSRFGGGQRSKKKTVVSKRPVASVPPLPPEEKKAA